MSINLIAVRVRPFAAVMLLSAALWCGPATGQTQARTLTGQVIDRQHEPLRGAVVVLQQEGTENITSYITDRNGNFSFKRLSGNVDYKVTATFRGKTSHSKQLSHFDSKPDRNIVFIIRLD